MTAPNLTLCMIVRDEIQDLAAGRIEHPAVVTTQREHAVDDLRRREYLAVARNIARRGPRVWHKSRRW